MLLSNTFIDFYCFKEFEHLYFMHLMIKMLEL